MKGSDGGFSLHLDLVESVGGRAAVLAVRGEVDAATYGELETALGRMLDEGSHVVVELSGLTFIDSSGLNAVVRVVRCKGQGQGGAEGQGTVVLAGATPAIARMLDMRGLAHMVPIHDSVDAALASFNG